MHGKVSTVEHSGRSVFRGINGGFVATRYHSLVVARDTCPADLDVTAEADGLIMGLAHCDLPIHGVQFHPESVLSENGGRIVQNFLDLAAAWNRERRDNSGLAVH
jgi:anthranilate synthase component II